MPLNLAAFRHGVSLALDEGHSTFRIAEDLDVSAIDNISRGRRSRTRQCSTGHDGVCDREDINESRVLDNCVLSSTASSSKEHPESCVYLYIAQLLYVEMHSAYFRLLHMRIAAPYCRHTGPTASCSASPVLSFFPCFATGIFRAEKPVTICYWPILAIDTPQVLCWVRSRHRRQKPRATSAPLIFSYCVHASVVCTPAQLGRARLLFFLRNVKNKIE